MSNPSITLLKGGTLHVGGRPLGVVFKSDIQSATDVSQIQLGPVTLLTDRSKLIGQEKDLLPEAML